MNILTQWHQSLDLLLSRQLFSFIKDTLCAIGRTYWLMLKYWWWIYLPLLCIEPVIWSLPMGYESFFFSRSFKLLLFAARLFCYFILILAALAPDWKVTFNYFKARISYFSALFFTLVIAYWMLLIATLWLDRVLSLMQADALMYHVLTLFSISAQYLILYPTEWLASVLFIFFVCWVIRDYFNGMSFALNRALHTLVYMYPVGLILNAVLFFSFKFLQRGLIELCSYLPSAAYVCLLDYDLLVAPIAVAVFVTLYTWHTSKQDYLYQ